MNPVTRHRLSAESFAVLARGEGTAAITRDLWATEESRRLLLISTLLNEIDARHGGLGPLEPIAAVLAILTEAQRAAPEAVRSLLLDPGVGSSCAYALRRLRGGAHSDAPLFVDLGVVHALGLAAAARAGLPWSARLPLREGDLMVHTFGLARFPKADADATVEASTNDGGFTFHLGRRTLVVPSDDTDSDQLSDEATWWALRRVTAGREPRLSVWVDDLDPLRDLGDPVRPARLDGDEFARWRGLIEDAWALLCRDYPDDADAMADGVASIVPLKHLPGWDTRSASNGEAFGGVMVSEPPDATIMAVSLIHEYQHIKLGALLHLIQLTEPDDGSLYYAPWRDDPRPLSGLIQGIYAFFGIARFWRIRLQKVDGQERDVAAFEYLYALKQTAESVHIGLAATGLTETGRHLLEGLRDQVGEWLAEPVEAAGPQLERLAQITADSHRTGWRLRHFRPRAEEVTTLAGLLERQQPPAAEAVSSAVIDPHPQLRWRQRIPAVARRQAVAAAANRTGGADAVAAGENALLAQDGPAARDAFAGELSRIGPAGTIPITDDEARAWAGLAISLADAGEHAAAAALSLRPDLVRAVYAAPGARHASTPIEVARWLAPVVGK
ncbi:HEXXH motif domain-containing protein [Actinoplanes sp. Pm04-4]|uniref:HEXXH motif domain-containing protein n=1 Tax=Paractinoplanes pyxinae TaxID=2997416 RepID=A0ABT4AWU1_9ACTN|nr:HEXXH motif domain-containing protein [Actinoplanes pyxinae]MCY1138145.1 HEXXH motif domain-containing protein [Actinoplanes pyxinae]